MDKLKVIIVDDSKRFRESLKILLENIFSAEIIAEASSGIEFLTIENSYQADIVFMDLCMDQKNGWEAAKEYLMKFPSSKVIALTMFSDKAYLVQLIEIGFKGYIYKGEINDHLNDAIDFVMNERLYFPNNMNLTLSEISSNSLLSNNR